MKITKNLINKFTTDLIISECVQNGYAKHVVAKVIHSKGYEYKIEVTFVPNELLQYNDISDICFLYPDGKYSWKICEVPKELYFVLNLIAPKLKYSKEEITYYIHEMNNYLLEYSKEMYG